jgi:thiol-disulfide isomerase/thioredoxin
MSISDLGFRISHWRAASAALFVLVSQASFAADAPRLAGEVDAKGLAQAIANEKGRVVLVNFWAAWCVPCREEFPDLVRLEKKYRDRGLSVVGVSTDLARDLPAVEKFLAATKPDFRNYRKRSGGDDQDFIESVDPKWGGELPFSVLYGRDGKKASVLSGKQRYPDFEKAVAKLLR